MSQTARPDPVPRTRRILQPYTEELAEAAADADRLSTADLCEVLHAWARGERPPEAPARRVATRLLED